MICLPIAIAHQQRTYGVLSPPDPDILAYELKVAIGPIVAPKHAILRAVLVMLSDPQSRGNVVQRYLHVLSRPGCRLAVIIREEMAFNCAVHKQNC